MGDARESKIRRRGRGAALAFALVAALIGLAGWLSYILDLQQLRTYGVGAAAMRPLTGVTLVIAAGAIVAAGTRWRWLVVVGGAVTLAVGAATLGEWFAAVPVGITGHLAPNGRGEPLSGRPSIPAAAIFVLLGLALLTLRRGRSTFDRISDYLAAAAALIAFAALTAYSYGASSFAPVLRAGATGIALPTSLASLALALALLCQDPLRGLPSIVTSDAPGGLLARRVLLVVAVVPPTLGVLLTTGHFFGFADVFAQLALLTVLASGLATAATLVFAHRLNLMDATRGAAESIALERERGFRALFEHSLDGIFFADRDGRYLDVNSAGCRLLRATRDEIVGKTIVDFIRPEEVPRLAADRERVFSGGTVTSDWQMRRGDGTPVDVEVSTCLLPDGRWLGLVRDISHRKEAEEQLRVAHEAEQRYHRELERLRDEWTAIVAHDLRQPVSVIALSAQLLERKCAAPNDAKLVERIGRGAERLRTMIDDLLDYAQIEAGRLRIAPRPVDLPSLVSEVVDRVAPTAEGHPIRIEILHSGARVEADPGRIDQVVTNLVANAAKYGFADSEIVVTVDARPSSAEIAVTNRGEGIPSDELPKLFSRFERTAGAVAKDTPGVGLGLYITKGIVEAHGGRVWAESTPNGLTTFHVALPRRAA